MVSFTARGVGFLRYFQFKQLPNFLLASPILTLALCSIIYYVKSRPQLVYSLGFRASNEGKEYAPVHFSSGTAPKSNSIPVSEKPLSKIQGITFKHMLVWELLFDGFLQCNIVGEILNLNTTVLDDINSTGVLLMAYIQIQKGQ